MNIFILEILFLGYSKVDKIFSSLGKRSDNMKPNWQKDLENQIINWTDPLVQTSDMGEKTVPVPANSYLLPYRANSGYILSISPLMYSRS